MSRPGKQVLKDIRFQKRLAVGLLIAGVVAVGAGALVFKESRDFQASASRAPGKIVELEQRRHDKKITCFPVFSFVDQSGVSHVVHSRFGYTANRLTLARQYDVGDAVEVIYAAADPEGARLNDFFSVWGWTLMLGGGGGLLLIIGTVLWHGAVTWKVELGS